MKGRVAIAQDAGFDKARPEPTVELGRARRLTVRVLAVIGLLTFSFMLIFVAADAIGRLGQDPELMPAQSPEAQFGPTIQGRRSTSLARSPRSRSVRRVWSA